MILQNSPHLVTMISTNKQLIHTIIIKQVTELTNRKKTTIVNAQMPPRRICRPFLAVFCKRRQAVTPQHACRRITC